MPVDRDAVGVHQGVLLGTFVADALGARWEGAGPVELDEARGRLDRSLDEPELRYTDDTQLALALAEHLCTYRDVDAVALVATFLDHFEPWRGYARGMHGIVEAWRAGLSPAAAATSVFPDGSFGNGAAMRVAPVGALHAADVTRTEQAATRQAVLTHAHPVGVDAAVVQARAVGLAARAGAFGPEHLDELMAVCATQDVRTCLALAVDQAALWPDTTPPAVAATIGTDVRASHSVAAALWVATVATGFEEAVVLALALGGDSDTIAAMACAVLGAAWTAAAIPQPWLDRLEDGPRGRGYAVDLAARLARASP